MENEKQSSISSNFPISKNAMKRQLKNEKIEATRGEWKARMREKIKLKKAAKRDTNLQPSNEKIIEKLPRVIQEEPSGEIIIDLSYESLMTKKELNSLVRQICRIYSLNRITPKPFLILVYGFNGGTKDEMLRSFPGYINWRMCKFYEEPLENCRHSDDLLYLSADSSDVIDSPHLFGTSLIIGGLVDRNRHKNVAYDRAVSLNLKTSKLPIEKHINLKSSTVLTIVNVMEILCKQRELGSWAEAINLVIPERKRS